MVISEKPLLPDALASKSKFFGDWVSLAQSGDPQHERTPGVSRLLASHRFVLSEGWDMVV